MPLSWFVAELTPAAQGCFTTHFYTPQHQLKRNTPPQSVFFAPLGDEQGRIIMASGLTPNKIRLVSNELASSIMTNSSVEFVRATADQETALNRSSKTVLSGIVFESKRAETIRKARAA